MLFDTCWETEDKQASTFDISKSKLLMRNVDCYSLGNLLWLYVNIRSAGRVDVDTKESKTLL